MSPRDHNKTLGVMHLIFGGMNAMALLANFGFIHRGGVAGLLGSFKPAASLRFRPEADLGLLVIFLLLFSVPPLMAGYGMLKRKSWAQGAGVIAAIAASLNPPLGTALCVYALWFLFGEGKHFYDSRDEEGLRAAARGASFYEDEERKARGNGQAGYEPPNQPPNWRE